MTVNLLLVSNSTMRGQYYLDHCRHEIEGILDDVKSVLFVPYAQPGGRSMDESTALPREAFEKMGFRLNGIHEYRSPVDAVEKAEAIVIGGGNTYSLLKSLYDNELIDVIRGKVKEGTPYIGVSAGANVSGPTIRTTNDMAIVDPPSLDAIDLVPFLINCHYVDESNTAGEPRDVRIEEYHAIKENIDTVVGLRDGAFLRITDDKIELKGNGAKIFQKGEVARCYLPGDSLDFLFVGKDYW